MPARAPRRWVGRLALGTGALVVGLGVLALRPGPDARLAIQVVPDQSFTVNVAKTADGEPATYDGTQSIALVPGDYFIDVVPASSAYQRKRLKVHLSGNQMLALPVVLVPSGPPRPAAPPEPPAAEERAPNTETTGKLALSSKPPGARVIIDGRDTGRVSPIGISAALELSAGKHIVELRFGSRHSTPVSVTIEGGQVSVLKGIELD